MKVIYTNLVNTIKYIYTFHWLQFKEFNFYKYETHIGSIGEQYQIMNEFKFGIGSVCVE